MKTLKVVDCLYCPHHGIERDPSSHDSFDWSGDSALVCRLAVASEEEIARRLRPFDKPGKSIVGCNRAPDREFQRRGSKIPDWCPLPESEDFVP